MRTYQVITKHGARDWQAEDADHAREQHVDAFPEEAVLAVQAAPRLFTSSAEAWAVAREISAMPRKGEARPQGSGYYSERADHDVWLVEVKPRADRYGNPRVLREDGTAVGYIEWADTFRPITIFP